MSDQERSELAVKQIEILEGKTKVLMDTIMRCNKKVEGLIKNGLSENNFDAYCVRLSDFSEDLTNLESDGVI